MREPARTEHAAQQRYTRILQQSLGCLTNGQWFVGPSPTQGRNLSLLTNPRRIPLRRSDGLPTLVLESSQLFTIVPDPRYPGEYKASTLQYIYELALETPELDEAPEVLSWHWHPLVTQDRPTPHMHVWGTQAGLVASLSKLHVPSGRVAFEEVVRFLFTDLDVTPARPDDWDEKLTDSYDRFVAHRTWS